MVGKGREEVRLGTIMMLEEVRVVIKQVIRMGLGGWITMRLTCEFEYQDE